MKTNITTEMIESIIFHPVGVSPHFAYKYKKIEVVSPIQNVAGLTQINGDFYVKIATSKIE